MRWTGNGSFTGRQPPKSAVRIRNSRPVANRSAEMVPYQTDYLIHGGDAIAVPSGSYLAHFGIPGMKWGIRRYQNEDGSYTEEGKQRYGRDGDDKSTWRKSDAKDLSDDELRRRNNRLQAEQQYKNLMTTEKSRDNAQLVKDFKKGILKALLITPIVGIAAYMGGKAIKDNGIKAISTIEKYAKKKVAGLKAANIIRNELKKPNVPHAGQYNPLHDYAVKRHPEWAGLEWAKRVGQ